MLMWISREVFLLLKAEIEVKQERIDRLTEAVARQQGVSLRSPLPETQPRQPIEKSRGWFEQSYNPFSEKKNQ